MGFLESVKRTFNIAGAEVCVQTKDDVYSQNDVVTGNVLIQGGQYDQEAQSIRLDLKEFWTETRSTGKSTRITCGSCWRGRFLDHGVCV